MIQFVFSAAAVFGLCWVWKIGYVGDILIIAITNATPRWLNERLPALAVLILSIVAGVYAPSALEDDTDPAIAAGVLLGFGAYIAVRLPGSIRDRRLAQEAAKQALLEGPSSVIPPGGSSIPPPPSFTGGPAHLAGGGDQSLPPAVGDVPPSPQQRS